MRARLTVVAALAALGLLTGVQPTFASPPDNDNFASAQVISSLPFSDSGDLNGTSTEPGEQQACNFQNQSVWYTISSSTAPAFRLNLDGSDFGVVANVWRSFGGINNLGFAGCIGSGGNQTFTIPAGATYYIQAGSVSFGPAHLQLNMDAIPAPANDDFAAATQISTLPFSESVDRTAATLQSDEPPFTSCGFIGHTVWYAYTAAQTQTLLASGNSFGNTFIAVYTGESLSSLDPLSCGSERNVFHVEAGRTYRIQVGGYDGQDGSMTSFNLDVAPQPSVAVFWSPFDPTRFDNVQFSASVFDPAAQQVDSVRWDFGDGTVGAGFSPNHRYAADGQYTAHATVTMVDGRTGSASAVVTVKTHDVAITKLSTPQSASVDQTKPVTVSVTNKGYPETVQVQLAKSVPGGWETVGTLTLSVPVRKTVAFKFSYVFTPGDAAIGKVSFQASAFLVSARDALPGDNVITSLATKVR
jgi:hypothetical protein